MRVKNQFVKDLKEKEPVSSPFLVKFSSVGTDKNGKPFMNLVFMDKTGEVEARVWDDVPNLINHAARDNFVWVQGKCQAYQGRKQIVIQSMQLMREDEITILDYLIESQLDASALYKEVVQFIVSMKDPFYRALAESILIDDLEIIDRFKRAPAAKSVHHAYKSGLIEHVVSITKILDFLASHYGSHLDRDLLFLGGFFHDIGKLWELQYDRTTDYTAEGKLIGHLVMGVELVERKILALESQAGRLPGPFPVEKKLLVKHLILSHHGEYEYGSPKRPKCLEAMIVHYIDDLDSKFNAIQGFIANDTNPGQWTLLSKMYGRFFFKPEWAQK